MFGHLSPEKPEVLSMQDLEPKEAVSTKENSEYHANVYWKLEEQYDIDQLLAEYGN
jgi:hypothetical protein